MDEDLMDWHDVVAAFHRRFGDWPRARWTGKLGVNFATPEVLGCLKVGNGVAVEVSTGIGIGGGRIYGLTVDRDASDRPHERDAMVSSMDEIAEWLEAWA